MPSPRVSLRVIALEAGVSAVTVSFALRGHPSIPERTARRIRQIAEKLGYRRDPQISVLMARLREKRAPEYQSTLVWLTAWATRDGWKCWARHQRFYRGAEERARALGYLVEEFWMREPGMTSARAASILKARGVQGIIVAPLPDEMETVDFDWSAFSAAAVGRSLKRPTLTTVDSANFRNMRLALETIHGRGYRRVGYLESTGTGKRGEEAWHAAFLVSQANAKAADRVPVLRQARITREQFLKWFEKHHPELIVSNEGAVVEWLKELGQRVPRDVAHVRLDRTPVETEAWLELDLVQDLQKPFDTLAGVDQCAELIGSAAVDAVVAMLHRNERGEPQNPKIISVRGRWLEGASIGRKSPAEPRKRSQRTEHISGL